MTARICLLRHALAQERKPGLADHQRQLLDKGLPKLQRSLGALRRLGFQPDRLVSSPYLRCTQTARHCLRTFGRDTEIWETLRPQDDGGDIAATAQALQDWASADSLARLTEESSRDLLVVGHEPDLARLCATLVGWPNQVAVPWSLKKSGFALLTLGAGGFHIAALAGPKLFS